MEFSEVVRSRYSVRKFDSRPIEPDKLQYILELARLVPTAVNYQPQRILVLQAPEDMAKLAKCTKYTFDAPAAIIVAADEKKAWVNPLDNSNSGIVDATIVATHIMLCLRDLDLGACWVGFFDPKAVCENFNFPDGVKPVAIFPIGYPAADSKPSAKHSMRLPLSDTVFYNHF